MKLSYSDKLIKKALSDLKVANDELITEEPAYDMICFHLQQFVEKYLKAYLFINKQSFPRTHNIPFLLEECTKIDSYIGKFTKTELINLNYCGVEVRYDDLDDVDTVFINEVFPIVIEFKSLLELSFNQNRIL